MATLEQRLMALEDKQARGDLAGMTVAELDIHLATLRAGSPEWFRVLMAGISRRGSRLPISTSRVNPPTSATMDIRADGR